MPEIEMVCGLDTGRTSPLCVVLTAAVGGYAITATTAQAIEAGDWFIKSDTLTEVFRMAKDIGAVAVGLLMIYLALGIALWSAAVGIKLATGVMCLLKMLGLNTLETISVGPLIALGASGTGALLGTAAGSLLVWGKQGLFVGLTVILLTSCILMWPFKPASLRNPLREHGLLMKQLMLFLMMQFIVLLLGMCMIFIPLVIFVFPVMLGPGLTRQYTLAQKLFRAIPGHVPDSGDLFVYGFCSVFMLTSLATGATGFYLLIHEGQRESTKIIILSCAHVGPLCATIMGAVFGIYTISGLKTTDAEKVSLGAVGTTTLALKAASTVLDSLGPSGTAGLLIGVGTIAGLSMEVIVIAAKMKYGAPGGASALLGAIGGAIVGTISMSAITKIPLLCATVAVAIVPNFEIIKQLGLQEAKPLETAVEGAVFFSLAAIASVALGLAILFIGHTGDAGILLSFGISLGPIYYFFTYTE